MLRKTGRVSWEVRRLNAAKPEKFTDKRKAQIAHAAECEAAQERAANMAMFGADVSAKVWLQEYHGNKLVCETSTPAAQE